MNDTSDPNPPDCSAAFPVVAIGASAGGVEQLKVLLAKLPADTGAAYVVMLHLSPTQTSQLDTLIAQNCDLEVVTIEQDMPLAPDRVHVIPPGQSLGLDGNILRLTATESHRDVTRVIDEFFRALAAARNGAAVGIVLSGSGSDGALGLKAIKAGGGLAMAQDPDSAQYDSMPRAAARSVTLDYVLDTAALAEPLINHLRLNFHRDGPEAPPQPRDPDISDDQLDVILETLRRNKNYSFASYKPNMLKRRIQRRMGLAGLEDVATYQQRLAGDARECVDLGRDFLISVTDFFRDPQAYKRLAVLALGAILRARGPDSTVRVWVPGCATGEEAYSVAMLLAEAIDALDASHGQRPDFIVFASDIDHAALDFARHALYPESIAGDVSEARLRRFFERVDHHYRVRSSLRERVVFATQNVIQDPPYSGLDLISCRNLLMYLKPDVQKEVLATFHFALNNGGFLALGSSETVGEQINLFEPVGQERRLFRRIGPHQRARVQLPFTQRPAARVPSADDAAGDASHTDGAAHIARDILLAEHVPGTILVNRKLEILCSYGPTRDFFALPFGETSLGAVEMALPAYRSPLRAVTHRAFRDHQTADILATHSDAAEPQSVRISARPLDAPDSARGLVLVTFTRLPGRESGAQTALPDDDSLNRQLNDELADTRRELNSTIAALEASNEDMKGSNEEILSMNEELQSANEELETSKEELQSVNEELTTVNSELEHKVTELENAHNDLDNLLAGTQVATLFLDHSLTIKRFTPTIRNVLHVVSTDVGRTIREIKFKIDDPDLIGDIDAVLDTLAPREREVQAEDGTWYQRRVLPYRTQKDTIDGVIVTFVDISPLMRLTLDSIESERRLDLALSAIEGGIWDIPLDATAPEALPDAIYLSPRFKALLGYADDEFPNSLEMWRDRIVAEDRRLLDDVRRLQADGAHAGVHYRIRHRDGRLRWFSSQGRVVHDEHGVPVRWVGVDFDISEEQQRRLDARRLLAQVRLLANALDWPVAYVDSDCALEFVNDTWAEWFGAVRAASDPEAGDAQSLTQALGADAANALAPNLDAALDGRTVSGDVELERVGHGECRLRANFVPHAVDDTVLGCYLILVEGDPAQAGTDQLGRHSGLVYLQRMATLGELAGTLAHDLRQPLTAINNYAAAMTRMLHAGKPPDETVPVLRKIADQVEHANGIITNTRRLIGKRDSAAEPADLNQIVESALTMTEALAREQGVERRLDLRSPLPAIECYAVQIEQIVINLVVNALDAMADTPREARLLWVATRQHDAGCVQLSVQDSGPGIAASEIGRIFDTFHTTKLDGLGVGLSLSRSIAETHRGALWAESPAGEGATFYLRLPVAAGSDDS